MSTLQPGNIADVSQVRITYSSARKGGPTTAPRRIRRSTSITAGCYFRNLSPAERTFRFWMPHVRLVVCNTWVVGDKRKRQGAKARAQCGMIDVLEAPRIPTTVCSYLRFHGISACPTSVGTIMGCFPCTRRYKQTIPLAFQQRAAVCQMGRGKVATAESFKLVLTMPDGEQVHGSSDHQLVCVGANW